MGPGVTRESGRTDAELRPASRQEAMPFSPGDKLPPEEDWRGDDKVLCFECGRWFRHVGRHVFLSHDMTADEYRARWKLRAQQSLASRTIGETRRQIAIASGGVERLRDLPGNGGGNQVRTVGENISTVEVAIAARLAKRAARTARENERARAAGFESIAAWIAHLRDVPMTQDEIAEVVGEPRREVQRIIKANGIPWRGPGPLRP